MKLAERLAEGLKLAMKNKDKVRLSVLRMVKAAVRNAEIDKKVILGDEEITGVFRKEVKQRKESILAIEGSGREDLIAEAQAELQILEEYLPPELTDEQIELLVRQVVSEVGATSKADIGKVMPTVINRTGGQADGRTINKIVQRVLSDL